MLPEIIFFILAGGAILFAALTISCRTAIYSSIFFVMTLVATAGIYLQLRAPLLFGAQLIAIVCVIAAVIVFAVEVSKVDVALASEYSWRAKSAAIAAASLLLLEIASDILLRRFLPADRLTALIPKASFPWPLSAVDVLKFFVAYDLLPLALLLLAAVAGVVGLRATFQRKA
jgi:NADH:ubiquinone oxidoreductase subunit 6 (subunit J)